MDKIEKYRLLTEQIRMLINGETDCVAVMANVCAAIHEAMEFWWTRFYRVKVSGENLQDVNEIMYKMNRYIAITAVLLTFHLVAQGKSKKAQMKPRLVVCTDIAPGDAEPDDMESMVRLMTYADCFEIEALITSVGWNCDPYPTEWKEYLTRVIEAYRKHGAEPTPWRRPSGG